MKRFIREENVLKDYVKGNFEERLLKAAFKNIRDHTNELRFNNFAYSIRELSRHILYRHSPDKVVIKAPWFVSEIANDPKKSTRAQRIKFAIQGGITDEFVRNERDIDLLPLSRRITKAIDKLSKFTHIEPDSLGISIKEVNRLVEETVGAFVVLFNTIATCRERIVRKIENSIDETLLDHVLEITLDDIDMLSTHSSVQGCSISKITIEQITASEIHILVSGSVAVRLQYGSNSDLRSGDGAVFNDSFPFTCKMKGDVNQLEDFSPDTDSIQVDVDTMSFYE